MLSVSSRIRQQRRYYGERTEEMPHLLYNLDTLDWLEDAYDPFHRLYILLERYLVTAQMLTLCNMTDYARILA